MPSPDLLARLAMPFFCAIPASTCRTIRTAWRRRRRPARTTSPSRHGEQVDHAQAKPVLQGQAAAQRRPDRLHDRELARRDVPARAAGCDRLRRRRHPARVVRRGRPEVRHQQGPVLGQAAALDGVPRVQHVTRHLQEQRSRSGRPSTRRSTARRMLAQGGFLAGKRTDQILPPGMAGFRDADLYPLKAAEPEGRAEARDRVTPATATVVLYEWNRGASPLARSDHPVQPQADRAERRHPALPAGRSDREGRHARRAVRHRRRVVGRRLRRPVRLHQRAARRATTSSSRTTTTSRTSTIRSSTSR